MNVDAAGVFFRLSRNGESFLKAEGSFNVSVVVQQSSCLQQEFIGTVQDGSNKICLDSDGSDFIIMDMRMQAGETIIQISLDTESYLFVLPHDSNFRELYDEQKAKGWFENVWSALECVDENYQPTGSTVMSTTGLFQGVHTSADGTQGESYLLMEINASGVGFAKLDRSQFTQAEEEYYNNAYNKAVEYLQVGMIGGMITGILNDF